MTYIKSNFIVLQRWELSETKWEDIFKNKTWVWKAKNALGCLNFLTIMSVSLWFLSTVALLILCFKNWIKTLEINKKIDIFL